jgi:hypothetical protein
VKHDRLFATQHSIRVADHGPRVNAYELVCAQCRARDHVTNARAAISPEGAKKRFERAGWTVGASRDGDFCPDCTKARAARAAPVTLPKVENNNVIVVPLKSEAERPREMSFDDRRLILAKLQDVYVDEKTGYAEGWTDQRLAVDLGVPRAWVEKLRAENFGPARDNEEVRKFFADLEAARKEARDLDAKVSAVAKELEDAKAAASRVGSVLARLERDAGLIRKAVGA